MEAKLYNEATYFQMRKLQSWLQTIEIYKKKKN